jgi:hypothetical protein
VRVVGEVGGEDGVFIIGDVGDVGRALDGTPRPLEVIWNIKRVEKRRKE